MKTSKFMEDVLTSAEKKAPTYMEQLQKGYWLSTSECTSVCAFLGNLAFPMNFPEFMSEPLWNILLKISFPTGYWQSVKEDCPCILKTIDSYFNKNVIWLKIWFLLNICDRHQRPTVLCLSDLDVSPQVVGHFSHMPSSSLLIWFIPVFRISVIPVLFWKKRQFKISFQICSQKWKLVVYHLYFNKVVVTNILCNLSKYDFQFR